MSDLYSIYNSKGSWIANVRADNHLAALMEYARMPAPDRSACVALTGFERMPIPDRMPATDTRTAEARIS